MRARPGDNFGEVGVARARAELGEIRLEDPGALVLLCGAAGGRRLWPGVATGGQQRAAGALGVPGPPGPRRPASPGSPAGGGRGGGRGARSSWGPSSGERLHNHFLNVRCVVETRRANSAESRRRRRGQKGAGHTHPGAPSLRAAPPASRGSRSLPLRGPPAGGPPPPTGSPAQPPPPPFRGTAQGHAGKEAQARCEQRQEPRSPSTDPARPPRTDAERPQSLPRAFVPQRRTDRYTRPHSSRCAGNVGSLQSSISADRCPAYPLRRAVPTRGSPQRPLLFPASPWASQEEVIPGAGTGCPWHVGEPGGRRVGPAPACSPQGPAAWSPREPSLPPGCGGGGGCMPSPWTRTANSRKPAHRQEMAWEHRGSAFMGTREGRGFLWPSHRESTTHKTPQELPRQGH